MKKGGGGTRRCSHRYRCCRFRCCCCCSWSRAFMRIPPSSACALTPVPSVARLRRLGIDHGLEEVTKILAAYDDDPNGRLDMQEWTALVHDLEEGTIREVGGGRRSIARLAPPLIPPNEPEMEAVLGGESPEPPRGPSNSQSQSPRARNVRGAAHMVAAATSAGGGQRKRASFASPPGGTTPRLPHLGRATEQHTVSPAAVVPSPHDILGRTSPSE